MFISCWLLCCYALTFEARRVELISTSLTSDDDGDVSLTKPGDEHDKDWQFKVVIPHHKALNGTQRFGIHRVFGTGRIYAVDLKSPAEAAGLVRNQYIVKVGKKKCPGGISVPFSSSLYFPF